MKIHLVGGKCRAPRPPHTADKGLIVFQVILALQCSICYMDNFFIVKIFLDLLKFQLDILPRRVPYYAISTYYYVFAEILSTDQVSTGKGSRKKIKLFF